MFHLRKSGSTLICFTIDFGKVSEELAGLSHMSCDVYFAIRGVTQCATCTIMNKGLKGFVGLVTTFCFSLTAYRNWHCLEEDVQHGGILLLQSLQAKLFLPAVD
jgi:hypothetical protein